MEEFDTNWSKEELKVYLLIYCANADFCESKEENEFILAKIKGHGFEKIHKEFDQDNDFQRIQKIRWTIEKQGYSQDGVNRLFAEMKELFLSDGKYATLEQNLFRGLRHIIEIK